jgi:hypothetical protein
MRLSALFLLAALSPACLIMDDGGAEEDALDPGYTHCGDPDLEDTYRYSLCQPSQYCNIYNSGWCSPGCLSNDNCAPDQRCVKGDADDVGTCQNAKRPTDDPREPENRPGVTICGTNDGVRSTCELGYFCADPGAALCEPGCLSSANCDRDERCAKAEGAHVGVCAAP